MNEQDLVKLKADCEIYKDRIHKLEQKTDDQEKRIVELEKKNSKTDYQYEQIIKMLDKLNDETIPNLVKQIESIKNKPAERYNLIITTLISSIIGAIVGYFIKFFQK